VLTDYEPARKAVPLVVEATAGIINSYDFSSPHRELREHVLRVPCKISNSIIQAKLTQEICYRPCLYILGPFFTNVLFLCSAVKRVCPTNEYTFTESFGGPLS
jgi:hypothetical protein